MFKAIAYENNDYFRKRFSCINISSFLTYAKKTDIMIFMEGFTMIKKIFTAFSAIATMFCGMTMLSFSASATTIDDVAEVARSYGYSEDLIMQGYNYYYENPNNYTSADFDAAIAELHNAGGSMITTGVYNPDGYKPTTTVAVTTSVANNSNNNKTSTTSTTPNSQTQNPVDVNDNDSITLKMNDGSTFTRMSAKEFIKLSYNDKMAYLQTFTPEQQQVFINNLSPEEYRSLLKQLPADKKIDVVDKLSNAVDNMGLNITINDITDDSLSVAMKNDDGELLGVANAGIIVEETGYNRNGVFAVAAILFAIAAMGIFFVSRKCFVSERIGDENEK